MVCSFCNENECESWLKSYCVDCSMLRRMLVLHNPTECVGILKRCLIRNQEQITNKIKLELKTQDKQLNAMNAMNDSSYNTPLPPLTRSKTK
mgnify:CR=1 FL=1